MCNVCRCGRHIFAACLISMGITTAPNKLDMQQSRTYITNKNRSNWKKRRRRTTSSLLKLDSSTEHLIRAPRSLEIKRKYQERLFLSFVNILHNASHVQHLLFFLCGKQRGETEQTIQVLTVKIVHSSFDEMRKNRHNRYFHTRKKNDLLFGKMQIGAIRKLNFLEYEKKKVKLRPYLLSKHYLLKATNQKSLAPIKHSRILSILKPFVRTPSPTRVSGCVCVERRWRRRKQNENAHRHRAKRSFTCSPLFSCALLCMFSFYVCLVL